MKCDSFTGWRQNNYLCNMKSLNKILLLCILLISCEKDEPAPAPTPEPVKLFPRSYLVQYSFFHKTQQGLQQYFPIASYKVYQNDSFHKKVVWDGAKKITVDDTLIKDITYKVSPYDTLFVYVKHGGITLYKGKGSIHNINLLVQ